LKVAFASVSGFSKQVTVRWEYSTWQWQQRQQGAAEAVDTEQLAVQKQQQQWQPHGINGAVSGDNKGNSKIELISNQQSIGGDGARDGNQQRSSVSIGLQQTGNRGKIKS